MIKNALKSCYQQPPMRFNRICYDAHLKTKRIVAYPELFYNQQFIQIAQQDNALLSGRGRIMDMNSIRTIADLLETVNAIYAILDGAIEIDNNGWPVFCKDHFLLEWPEDMVTFDNRNSRLIRSKSTTLLCHFTGDKQNYRRFPKLIEDIPKYRDYLAVVFPDITVTKDMDIEMQELILLTNHLYAAVLAINGIKLVFNTRTGSPSTVSSFRHIPRGIVCASSFLGCIPASDIYATSEYINKILRLMPDKLVIYGKQDLSVNAQLDTLGINYRYYEDFHRRSKRRVA